MRSFKSEFYMFFILYRSKCFSNTLQDNKRSRRAKGEAAARKGSVQALQTEPSLVKVSEPLCTFSFHTSGTNALRREHSEILVPPSAIRFPCCGRAYPCDVCHDENQDHPMELATRMICGYCAKEQVSCRLEEVFIKRITFRSSWKCKWLKADFTICLFMTTILSRWRCCSHTAMENPASAVGAWWREVPAPATGREGWDAGAKSKWTGTITINKCLCFSFSCNGELQSYCVSLQKWSAEIQQQQQNGVKEGSQPKEVDGKEEEEHHCLNLGKKQCLILDVISMKLSVFQNRSLYTLY